MRRRPSSSKKLGLVPAALLGVLLLLPSSALAAPNNGSAALAKAASEKEVLPAPEDPRDADGKKKMFHPSIPPSWPIDGKAAIGIESPPGLSCLSMTSCYRRAHDI